MAFGLCGPTKDSVARQHVGQSGSAQEYSGNEEGGFHGEGVVSYSNPFASGRFFDRMRHWMQFLRTLLFFALTLLAGAARGQSASDPALFLRDLSTARALGMGNAFHALGFGTEAVMGSPATMSLRRRYTLDLGGFWDSDSKLTYGGAGILDSATSPVAAGTAYQLVSDGRGNERRTSNLSTFGIGIPLADSFHIGASARHLFRSGSTPANAVTMDAGAAASLGQAFTLAVTGHNLIDTAHTELRRFYSLGLGFSSQAISLAADVRGDVGNFHWSRLSYSGGAEIALMPQVPIRGGYFFDGFDQRQGFSVGLGFLSDGTGLDLAYRHDVTGPGRLFVATLRFDLGRPG